MSVFFDNEKRKYSVSNSENHTVESVNKYLDFLEVCGKSPNTIRSYAYHLSTYIQYCEEKGIDFLTVFDSTFAKPIDFFVGFMTWLQYPDYSRNIVHIEHETVARDNKTVNIIVGTVLSFYEYLSANSDLKELPVYRSQRNMTSYKSFLSELMHHNLYYKKSILKKPEVRKPVEAISRDQYYELLQNCNLLRDKLLLAFMFEGGLRLSEALGIHNEDLNRLEEGIVKIVPRENNENGARVKNYAGGIIKLPDYVVDALLGYLASISMYHSDFLFVNESGKNKGSPVKADTVEKLFLRLSDNVGYKVHPHMLRHGFATEKLESGWQMVDIQAYLRHKSIYSTQIYASYSDELKKEKMREFLNENGGKLINVAQELRTK